MACEAFITPKCIKLWKCSTLFFFTLFICTWVQVLFKFGY